VEKGKLDEDYISHHAQRLAYVTNEASDTVSVIAVGSSPTVVKTIPVGPAHRIFVLAGQLVIPVCATIELVVCERAWRRDYPRQNEIGSPRTLFSFVSAGTDEPF
jgi:YVTN family beta-propeller protein